MIRVAVIGGLIGLLAVGSLSAVLVSKTAEEKTLRDRLGTANAAVQRFTDCDAALDRRDLFAVEAKCTLPVKTIVAQRDARASERDNLQTQLDQVRRDQAAAIARAEARGRAQTLRTQNAQDRLDAAPRTAAGLGQCDADCLQRLGEPVG